MNTIYHLNSDELNEMFLQSVRSLFKGKKITIVITSEIDETEYLLQSDTNRKKLLESIENVKQNKNLRTFNNIDELEQAVLQNYFLPLSL